MSIISKNGKSKITKLDKARLGFQLTMCAFNLPDIENDLLQVEHF